MEEIMSNDELKDLGSIQMIDHIKITNENGKILRNQRGSVSTFNKSSDYQEYEENNRMKIEGHVFIKDIDTGEVLLDKDNAINYETMSIAIAQALTGNPTGQIFEMHFGNGGTVVSNTGVITYFPPNVTGLNAQLYNDTYFKVINNNSSLDTDTTANNMTVSHTTGLLYTDIIITCTLGYGEPVGQDAFDNTNSLNNSFVFNEIGLKSYNQTPGAGYLLTHIIFSPVQKSLNRRISVQYTLRISLCGN